MKILPLQRLVLVGSVVFEFTSGWLQPSASSTTGLSPLSSTNRNSNSQSSRKMVTQEGKSFDSPLISSIRDAIREVLQDNDIVQQHLTQKYDLVLRQVDDWEDDTIKLSVGDIDHQKLALPLHFGLSLNGVSPSSSQSRHGLVTFYMAYSTWEGRMLYVDHLSIDSINDGDKVQIELLILQALARIAVKLNCSRLMWRVRAMRVGLNSSFFVCNLMVLFLALLAQAALMQSMLSL